MPQPLWAKLWDNVAVPNFVGVCAGPKAELEVEAAKPIFGLVGMTLVNKNYWDVLMSSCLSYADMSCIQVCVFF